MSEIEKVFSKYGDTVGRVYLTLFYSYSAATFELQKNNDNRSIADYNKLFNQYVQNNYGVEFFHLYEQFAKENETNLQLRNELKERHTEFINIAVFLLAGEKGSTQNDTSKPTTAGETNPVMQQASQEKKPKYGSVSIKGMKADFEYAEPDKAIPVVKAATFLQPHDADNWCILGNLYIEKKDWGSAVACFDKALSKNPKSTRALAGKERAMKLMA